MSDCNHTTGQAVGLPAAADTTGDGAVDQPHAGDDAGGSLVRLQFARGVTGREVAAAVFALHRARQARRQQGGRTAPACSATSCSPAAAA